MPEAHRLTTTVSAKGQVVLPKVIRQSRRWEAGTRLAVEDTGDGVLLKPLPVIASTHPEDVFGILARAGTPRALAEIKAGTMAAARRRHAGN